MPEKAPQLLCPTTRPGSAGASAFIYLSSSAVYGRSELVFTSDWVDEDASVAVSDADALLLAEAPVATDDDDVAGHRGGAPTVAAGHVQGGLQGPVPSPRA